MTPNRSATAQLAWSEDNLQPRLFKLAWILHFGAKGIALWYNKGVPATRNRSTGYQFRRTKQSPIGAMQARTAISLTELKAKMPDQADNLDPASIRTLEQ
jgi:hypothetical protein